MGFNRMMDDTFAQVTGWFSSDQSASFIIENGVWLAGLTGLFIGVFIAAFYAKKVAVSTMRSQQQHALDSENDKVTGYLQALHVESKIVFEIYQNKIGQHIEALIDGQALQKVYPQHSDYFCVYNGNTHMLGRVANSALRLQIVKANTLFKGVLNSLQENETLYFEYLSHHNIALSSLKPIDENRANKQLNLLKSHGVLLRKEHVLMSAQMQQMLAMLRTARQEKPVSQ